MRRSPPPRAPTPSSSGAVSIDVNFTPTRSAMRNFKFQISRRPSICPQNLFQKRVGSVQIDAWRIEEEARAIGANKYMAVTENMSSGHEEDEVSKRNLDPADSSQGIGKGFRISVIIGSVQIMIVVILAIVRAYYQQFLDEETQNLVDQRVKEHLAQRTTFPQQIGPYFQQHIASLPAGQQRPVIPVLRPPTLPIPGSTQIPNGQPLLPIVHPPVLPQPTTGPQGYGVPMGMSATPRPPGAEVTSLPGIAQSNFLPIPPTVTPLVSTERPWAHTPLPISSGHVLNPPNSPAYQNQQQNSILPSNGTYPANLSQQSGSLGLPNPSYLSQQSGSLGLPNPSYPTQNS